MARRKRPQVVQPQARYDAAGQGRRIKSWSPPSSGPNTATEGLQRIRNRARDTSRNDWAGETGVQKWTTNLVGVGITPRWDDERITERYLKWVPKADADGVLDLYGLQTLGTRSWLDGGEVFIRRRPRSLALDLPAPLQVQLIEADFVPLLDTDSYQGLPAGNTIRQGIERNKYGRRTAYWMYREHPGDTAFGASVQPDQLVRVLASDVRQVFEPKRPGQLRGVSLLAPVLARLRATMDFEDAVLDRQKLANLFTLFIKRELPPTTAQLEYDPLTGLPVFYDKLGKAVAGLEPGMTQELAPGEDITFANPPEAGTTYSDYMRTTHMGTASGAGMPYELFSGDLRDISDRTLRIVVNEFRRFAKQRQWQILIPMFCQPMIEWWAEAEVLAGTLPLELLEAAKAPEWSPDGWEYIHPVQDAEGKKLEVEAGFRSRSSVIAARGDDPHKVDAERSDDLKRSKKLGLEPPEPPKPAPAPKPAPSAFEEAGVRAFNAQASLAMSQQAALERAPAPAETTPIEHFVAGLSTLTTAVVALVSKDTTPVVHNHLPAPVVDNTVNVAPSTAVVDNTVNVAPSTAVVENTVNVAPADVVIPMRETITEVTDRDPDTGAILRTKRTEVPRH